LTFDLNGKCKGGSGKLENREYRHTHKLETHPEQSERHPKGYFGTSSTSAVNVKVRGLAEGENSVELQFDAKLLDYPPYHGTANLIGIIERHGERLTLTADVSAEGDFECTRCVDDFRKIISTPIVLQFVPFRLETNDDDPNVHTYDPVAESTVDILPDLRDALILAIPMRNLCRPNCNGLCPVCGKDRNKESCSCAEPEEVTGQWSALKGLSERLRAEEI
jgi:uncharacterized protein